MLMTREALRQTVPPPECATEVPGDRPAPAPAAIKLERRVDGLLWAVGPHGECEVKVSRCFPWSEPGRFISLRDREDDEVLLVRDLAELDARSRGALERSLLEAGFVLEIVAVLAVEEEVEIRAWKVETPGGVRSFQTPRDEWPRDVPGGGMLVRDVAGDLFYIADPDRLDANSRRLLWAFVDDD